MAEEEQNRINHWKQKGLNPLEELDGNELGGGNEWADRNVEGILLLLLAKMTIYMSTALLGCRGRDLKSKRTILRAPYP